MENNDRKATDVILDLESKIDTLLALVRTQDSNIKILSNKLNSVISLLEKNKSVPPVYVEPVKTKQTPFSFGENIAIDQEVGYKVDNAPIGIRRGSRHEANNVPDMPILHMAPEITPEIIIPKQVVNEEEEVKERKVNTSSVFQRVVSDTNKSIFLADVTIFSNKSNKQVFKGKTGANGKWSSNLEIGDYRVVIAKTDNITKEKKTIEQNIKVSGDASIVELPQLIIK